MTWATLLPVIIEHGIPYAFKLWDVISRHPEPTLEAWKELLAFSDKTYDDYIREAKEKVGL